MSSGLRIGGSWRRIDITSVALGADLSVDGNIVARASGDRRKVSIKGEPAVLMIDNNELTVISIGASINDFARSRGIDGSTVASPHVQTAMIPGATFSKATGKRGGRFFLNIGPFEPDA